jgi:hypothetical protein
MTVDQVVERARVVGDRWTLWRTCGPLDLTTLPTTDRRAEHQPVRYCPKCWTLFGPTGQPLNAPRIQVNQPVSGRLRRLLTSVGGIIEHVVDKASQLSARRPDSAF